PVRIGPWERTDFVVQSRGSDSYFGEHSLTWRYSRSGASAVVSLDSPFPSLPDLTWCYVGTGWRTPAEPAAHKVAGPAEGAGGRTGRSKGAVIWWWRNSIGVRDH